MKSNIKQPVFSLQSWRPASFYQDSLKNKFWYVKGLNYFRDSLLDYKSIRCEKILGSFWRMKGNLYA